MKNPDALKDIKTVVRAAYDDHHKKQTAAQKILMGRMLAISPLKNQQIAGKDTYCDLHTLRPEKEPIEKKGE